MRSFFIFALCVFALVTQAQKIEFDETKHQFGEIKESGGPVSYTFTFKNTGTKPLLLSHVQASCGCTTPNWSKAPIPPGGKEAIKAVFNPKNRNGNFNKSIRVTSNAENGTQTLYISGKIQKAPPKLEDYFGMKVGDLHFRSTYAAFTRIKDTEKKTKEVEFVNLSDKPVSIAHKELPAGVSLRIEPSSVKPKQKGKVYVTFDGSKAKEYGYSMRYVYLKINGKEDRKFRIAVSTNVSEDFSQLTKEERENAPHAEFDNAKTYNVGSTGKRVSVEFDFGLIKPGEKVEHMFTFKNTGKSDLIIRRTKASCGCTAIVPTSKVIKPGDTGEIKTVFNSKGRSGKQRKSITVTLNDPDSPVVKLYINGEIESEKKK